MAISFFLFFFFALIVVQNWCTCTKSYTKCTLVHAAEKFDWILAIGKKNQSQNETQKSTSQTNTLLESEILSNYLLIHLLCLYFAFGQKFEKTHHLEICNISLCFVSLRNLMYPREKHITNETITIYTSYTRRKTISILNWINNANHKTHKNTIKINTIFKQWTQTLIDIKRILLKVSI